MHIFVVIIYWFIRVMVNSFSFAFDQKFHPLNITEAFNKLKDS